MIKQITEKSVGHRVRFHLFYSPERWIYFKVDKMPENIESLGDFIERQSKKSLPKGVYHIDTVDENKIFEILYNETEITEEKVIEFAYTLGL